MLEDTGRANPPADPHVSNSLPKHDLTHRPSLRGGGRRGAPPAGGAAGRAGPAPGSLPQLVGLVCAAPEGE